MPPSVPLHVCVRHANRCLPQSLRSVLVEPLGEREICKECHCSSHTNERQGSSVTVVAQEASGFVVLTKVGYKLYGTVTYKRNVMAQADTWWPRLMLEGRAWQGKTACPCLEWLGFLGMAWQGLEPHKGSNPP